MKILTCTGSTEDPIVKIILISKIIIDENMVEIMKHTDSGLSTHDSNMRKKVHLKHQIKNFGVKEDGMSIEGTRDNRYLIVVYRKNVSQLSVYWHSSPQI